MKLSLTVPDYLALKVKLHNLFVPQQTKCLFQEYIGITLSVHISCKRISSYELILMKLYTVSVHYQKMCIKEDISREVIQIDELLSWY